MKKHLLKMLLIVAASFVVTSCFDNSEPESLQALREAKSELIKAQAAVQLAEAELRKAEALAKEAEARITTAQAEALEIANAIQSARNEAEKKELELKLERLVEQQKRDLAQLQAETARWEAEYQKALIDLEATLATYRNSKYAGELALVLQDLKDARNQITLIRGQIATKQGELLTYLRRDSLTTNRLIRTALATAQKDYDLGVEKVTLLKEAREGNIAEWGKARDKIQTRMKEMELAWVNMEPQTKEWAQQQRTLQIQSVELLYALDGDYTQYAQNIAQLGVQPNPSLDVAQTLMFSVPTSLQPLFERYIGGFEKEGNTYSATIDGMMPTLRQLLYGNHNGHLYVDEIPENATLGGMIPTIGQWTLSANDIAYAEVIKGQYEVLAAKLKGDYEHALSQYNERRQKYMAAAEAYGFDWTLTDYTRRTLWSGTRGKVVEFYGNYDSRLATNPGYVPSDIELKTITSQIANYLRKRVALTCEYNLDPIVQLDPMDAATRMRLSTALTATGTMGADFRYSYMIGIYADGRFVMGNSENLTWNVNRISNPDSGLYDAILLDLAWSIQQVYGLSYNNPDSAQLPLMLIDLDPDTDLKVESQTTPGFNYTQIVPNNYTVMLNIPILNIPYTNQSMTQPGGTLSQLHYGFLYDYLTTRAALNDLTSLIILQGDIATLTTSLTAVRTALLKEYRKAVINQQAADKEWNDVYNRYMEALYATNITDTSTAAYMEYSYCDMMFALLDGYINRASITLSDGSKYNVMADIDQAIKTAEEAVDPNTPGGLYEALERAKANLQTWEELGYSDLNGIDNAIGIQIRAAIADLQADIADAQAEFERCTELKDRLIGLMKTE